MSIEDPENFELATVVSKNSRSKRFLIQLESLPIKDYWLSEKATSTIILKCRKYSKGILKCCKLCTSFPKALFN